ncbi:DUF3656 domain-containing U32 family peptidase [Pectinatus cerevisiiphilus]|uniref:Putative protease n=1 Tax=Pectinatus cerevisiiphilus TaxID=86956 RepID=A0A4R3K5D5_9FIRM|nr:U32 family peptidase [Pectinatus cerevisiiphilus]TCS78006.1 putative protease [Pectinatus cerevisiiphilus]
MVELLAPAGTWEALKAAVESGANAVYLSGKSFGARAFADNFDEESLKKAVTFAHMRNVSIHVTVNTLVDNSELPALANYLIFLYTIGVDAIIVQDLGVAKIAHEIVPDLPLHASTQMSINNLDSVKMLEKLHFSRVVLAREVSLNDIKYICKNAKIEIETFIHGAICVCYSGQCLMSSMIGGRSGNRGRCAQPCRLPYTLMDEKENDLLQNADAGQYLLSPRDMNTLDLVPELIEAGVSSFKIEGRMKKPEYVAVVVNAYRKKIDTYYNKTAFPEKEVKKELSQIFNRDFTTAYLLDRPGRTMISDRKPNNRGLLIGRVQKYNKKTFVADIKLSGDLNIGDKVDFWVKVGGRVNTNVTELKIDGKKVESAHSGDVASIKLPGHVQEHDRIFKILDAKLNEKAKTFFNSSDPVRRIPLDITLTASIGEPVKIDMVDGDQIHCSFTADFIAEKALKRPLTYETTAKQMDRLGSTIYYLRKLECNIADSVMVPMSVLNDIRRQAVDILYKKRLQHFTRQKPKRNTKWEELLLPHQQHKKQTAQLMVAVDNIQKLSAALKGGCDDILFGGDSYHHQNITAAQYTQAAKLCQDTGAAIFLAMPRILRQSETDLTAALFPKLPIDSFAGVYVHSVGQLKEIKDLCDQYNKNLPIWVDYSMNVFNNATIETLKEQDVSGCVLSPELNMQQLKVITNISPVPLEVLVQGNIELMVSEYCIAGSFLGGLHTGSCTAPCTKQKLYLRDRKDEHFPIVTDQFCHMHILNGRELVMLAHVPDLIELGLNRLRIDGRYMSSSKLTETVKLYKEVMHKGKYHKIFQNNLIEKIEGNNFTRGHFFRGILSND